MKQLIAVGIILALVLSGCTQITPPADSKASLDPNAVLQGRECRAGNECPGDYSCLTFRDAGIETPACIKQPVELYAKCPAGTRYVVLESDPGHIICKSTNPLDNSGTENIPFPEIGGSGSEEPPQLPF